MLRQAIDSIVCAVYPQQCFVCRCVVGSRQDGVACNRCWSETRIFDGSEDLCWRCGAMQDRTIGETASCPNCHDAYYDRAVAAGVYEKALAATIVDLKKQPTLSNKATLLIRDLVSRVDSGDTAILIPVPLSRLRKFERGYNQAEIIASVYSQYSRAKVVTGCLVRSKQTPMHRVAMDKRARELTVEKAFTVRSPRLIEGKEVILVDDVLTSGSTASACARVLKKNGAAMVTVVTLARAVMHF